MRKSSVHGGGSARPNPPGLVERSVTAFASGIGELLARGLIVGMTAGGIASGVGALIGTVLGAWIAR